MIERYRGGRRIWNTDEDAILRACYPDESTAVLATRLGRPLASTYQRANALGLKKSAAYLASDASCRLRRDNSGGIPYRFVKGQTPANKGLRRPGWGPGRMKATQFQPGIRRGVAVKLWKPIGTERVSKDGYLQRKVNDGMPLQRRWKAVHIITWEAENGPLPVGHVIVFRNGDKADIRLSKPELAEATGMSVDGGSFRTYLSRLRTLELIEGKSELRASEELFS